MIFTSEAQAVEVLAYYKELVDLRDWAIALKWKCRHDEFILKGCSGEVEYEPIGKCCIIRLLDPIDYGDRIIDQDQEKTLVHELLHLVYAIAEKGANDTQEWLLHQNIDVLAKALVQARRDNKQFQEGQ